MVQKPSRGELSVGGRLFDAFDQTTFLLRILGVTRSSPAIWSWLGATALECALIALYHSCTGLSSHALMKVAAGKSMGVLG